jgi:hypothetical protein
LLRNSHLIGRRAARSRFSAERRVRQSLLPVQVLEIIVEALVHELDRDLELLDGPLALRVANIVVEEVIVSAGECQFVIGLAGLVAVVEYLVGWAVRQCAEAPIEVASVRAIDQ